MSTETGSDGDTGVAEDSGTEDDADVAHANAEQQVVAVDADDNEEGVVNRLEAHTGDGTRHRAFTVIVLDEDRNVLLAQRAPGKREVCAVLKCMVVDRTLDPDPDEVGGWMWVPYDHLYENQRLYRQLRLCPWFEIAMRRDLGD